MVIAPVLDFSFNFLYEYHVRTDGRSLKDEERSLLTWKRARFKVQLHFSSLNMYYTTIVKGPSYIFDASFFRMPLPPRKYIYENYFARGLTHQFSIDHHTLIHTQYTLKIPKKVHSFFFHLWVVPKFLCSKNNSVLPFLSF